MPKRVATWDTERRLLEYRDAQGFHRITLPTTGVGGVTDHAALSNLSWTAGLHTGTASRLAGFNGAGAAAFYVIGTDVQAYDPDLDGVSGVGTTGILVRTGAGAWTTRTLGAPAAGIAIADPSGVGGAPTFSLVNDLAALEGLGGTGFSARTAADTWATRTLQAGVGIAITNPAGIAGDPSFSTRLVDPRYGDGSDGNITLVGNYTANRDYNPANLNLAGFAWIQDGFRLAVRDTLTFANGTIRGIAGNGGSNAAGNSSVTGSSLGAGGPGATGASGANNGNNATNQSNVWSQYSSATGEPLAGDLTTGRGGAGGGNATPRTGGTAATVAKPTPSTGWSPSTLHMGVVMASTSFTRLVGGGGGGSGASDLGFAGGSGGGHSNVVVSARRVDATGGGTITGNGGNGGAGAGTNSGGGGGGGGGKILFQYESAVSGTLPTLTSNGGTGGAKTGTGVAGTNGNGGHTEAHCTLA